MTNTPNPGERPDPYDPYAKDPYVQGGPAEGNPPYPNVYEPSSQAPPGAPPPAGPPGAPPGPPPQYVYQAQPPNTSAIVLTVVSGIYVITGYCCPIGIAPLILGILGISKNASDPEGAASLTKTGWIIFAALNVVLVIAAVIFVIAVIVSESQGY